MEQQKKKRRRGTKGDKSGDVMGCRETRRVDMGDNELCQSRQKKADNGGGKSVLADCVPTSSNMEPCEAQKCEIQRRLPPLYKASIDLHNFKQKTKFKKKSRKLLKENKNKCCTNIKLNFYEQRYPKNSKRTNEFISNYNEFVIKFKNRDLAIHNSTIRSQNFDSFEEYMEMNNKSPVRMKQTKESRCNSANRGVHYTPIYGIRRASKRISFGNQIRHSISSTANSPFDSIPLTHTQTQDRNSLLKYFSPKSSHKIIHNTSPSPSRAASHHPVHPKTHQ